MPFSVTRGRKIIWCGSSIGARGEVSEAAVESAMIAVPLIRRGLAGLRRLVGPRANRVQRRTRHQQLARREHVPGIQIGNARHTHPRDVTGTLIYIRALRRRGYEQAPAVALQG